MHQEEIAAVQLALLDTNAQAPECVALLLVLAEHIKVQRVKLTATQPPQVMLQVQALLAIMHADAGNIQQVPDLADVALAHVAHIQAEAQIPDVQPVVAEATRAQAPAVAQIAAQEKCQQQVLVPV